MDKRKSKGKEKLKSGSFSSDKGKSTEKVKSGSLGSNKKIPKIG